jgi:hypothetical protein
MRTREIDNTGNETVGVVVHRLLSTRVEHVDPHLFQRPAESFAKHHDTKLRKQRREHMRRLDQQRTIARLQHRGVNQLAGRIIRLIGSRSEMLHQPAHQLSTKRTLRPHERRRKQANDFGHEVVIRFEPSKSMNGVRQRCDNGNGVMR